MKMKLIQLSLVLTCGLCSTLAIAETFSPSAGMQSIPAASSNKAGAKASVNQLLGEEMSPATNDKNKLTMDQIKNILAQQENKQAADSNKASGSSQSAPVAPSDSTLGDTAMSQQAFANMVRSLMPLSPDQIRTLRQLFDRSQKAAAASPGTPPRPTSTTIMVDLSPGATPPIVRLSNSFVSSLVFLDSTGQPWPISAYDIGDPNSFDVKWDRKGNTLLVQPSTTYRSGNIAVMLKGKDTPVMVTLIPGQHAVDYRADLRIPGLGPNASSTTDNLPSVANPSLLTFLNGVPPQGAKSMTVSGGPGQAWSYKGNIYIRTTLRLLSPSWLASMSSPDGTHVYQIKPSPVVLASFRGQVVQLKIEEASSHE